MIKPLSNTHCIVAAGQPDERLVEDRPVEPQVDGDDRRRRSPACAIDHLVQRAAVRRRTGRRSANHGTADTTQARRPPLAARLHRHDAVAVATSTVRGRARPDRSAVALDERARRLGVHQVQRPGRQARSPPRADRRRTSRPARARTAARRPDPAADSAPRAPADPRASRAAAASGRCGSASARRFRPATPPCGVAPGSSSRRASLQRRPPCRAPTGGRATTARPTRARRRADETAAAAPGTRAATGGRRDRSSSPPAAAAARTWSSGADVAQERERLGVAAEQHVLAVVDELAGLAIGKRRRPAAQARPRLEHEHARAALAPAGPPRSGRRSRRRSRSTS